MRSESVASVNQPAQAAMVTKTHTAHTHTQSSLYSIDREYFIYIKLFFCICWSYCSSSSCLFACLPLFPFAYLFFFALFLVSSGSCVLCAYIECMCCSFFSLPFLPVCNFAFYTQWKFIYIYIRIYLSRTCADDDEMSFKLLISLMICILILALDIV